MLLLPWGLFYFEAMASILVITFSIPLLLYGSTIQRDRMFKMNWPFFMIFGIILVSGFWTRDSEKWLSLLRINLPFVVLPAAYYIWPHFLAERRKLFQRQFILAGAALSVWLIVYSGLHMEAVTAMIREGGYFPVPVHHVRISLFLAIAGIFGWEELAHKKLFSNGFLFYGVVLVVVIAGIHLLAVRTGLFLFYIGTMMTFIFNNNFHGRRGLYWIGTLTIILVVAILFIPTLEEKWLYFLEDIRNYDSSSRWFYSDAVRWQSNAVGWGIARDHIWWGIGMGDVIGEMHLRFYNQENIRIWEYPHNLWVTFLAGSGLVGFLLLNAAIGRLFYQVRRTGKLVYRIIFILFMISCLFENTLLTSLGSISFVMVMLLATGKLVHQELNT